MSRGSTLTSSQQQERTRQLQKEWKIKNKDKLKAYHAAYNKRYFADPLVKVNQLKKSKIWRENNKDRVLAWSKEYRLQNRDKIRKLNKLGAIRRMYGLTAHELDNMFQEQGGKCKSCGVCIDLGSKSTHIDHDHNTGKVRGILCRSCNASLGFMGEDPGRIEALAKYARTFCLVQGE